MLYEFLTGQRLALIKQWQLKAAIRRTPREDQDDDNHGIPAFLDQLIKTLRMQTILNSPQGRQTPFVDDPSDLTDSEISGAAARHGLELLANGFTVDQVVREYGMFCQAITGMASSSGITFEIDEFQTMYRCLDNAIASAVREFTAGRECQIGERGIQKLNERIGVLAHELRNLIHIAKYAFDAVKRDKAGVFATAQVVDRSLNGLSALIDRALADVRVGARIPMRTQPVSVADFIAEVQVEASMDADARGGSLIVSPVNCRLAVQIDRQMMSAAVGNLLQNAFKFSHACCTVFLDAYRDGDRVRIDVKDRCGGLPPGLVDKMFLPFTQGGADKTGLGLGLSIARRTVEAHGGILSVRNMPGVGCIFTIDLPQCVIPTTSFCEPVSTPLMGS